MYMITPKTWSNVPSGDSPSSIYTVIDIETTGLSRQNSEIIEFGALRVENVALGVYSKSRGIEN